MKQIKNTSELRRMIASGHCEFRLVLRGGLFSRKTVGLCADGRFAVVNHIDDSKEKLTGRQLYTHSNIGSGMKNGALYADCR